MPRLVVPHSDIPGSGKSAERCFCARKICKIVRKRKEKNSSNCCELFVSFCKNTVYNSLTKFSRFFCVQNKGYQLNAKCAKLYEKEKKNYLFLYVEKTVYNSLTGFFLFFSVQTQGNQLNDDFAHAKCEKLYAKFKLL